MKNFSKVVTKVSFVLATSLMLVSCGSGGSDSGSSSGSGVSGGGSGGSGGGSGGSSGSGGSGGGSGGSGGGTGGDTNTPVQIIDTTPPAIKSFSSGVKEISFVFDEDVKDLSESNFELKQGSKKIDFSLSKVNSTKFTLTMKNELNFGTKYEAKLKDIEDLKGNKLNTSHIFTTTQSKVVRTGQIMCDKMGSGNNHTEVACTNPAVKGQDGYYVLRNLGVARSFTRNAQGVVIDNITKLQWQDNMTNTFDKTAAVNYCDTLVLDGKDDWRLPSRREFATISNQETDSPGKFSVFQNLKSASHWGNGSFKFSFNTGLAYSPGYSTVSHNVICVRGEALPKPTCTRDETSQTVTCTDTNLQWQDDKAAKVTEKIWKEAPNYCEALEVAGKKDWRLPNANELISIYEDTTIDKAFKNVATKDYFSSTGKANFGMYLAIINDFSTNPNYNAYNIRCVRTAD